MLHRLPGRHSALQKAVRSHVQLIALPAVRHPCENACTLMHVSQAWHQQHQSNCYTREQDRCAETRLNSVVVQVALSVEVLKSRELF